MLLSQRHGLIRLLLMRRLLSKRHRLISLLLLRLVLFTMLLGLMLLGLLLWQMLLRWLLLLLNKLRWLVGQLFEMLLRELLLFGGLRRLFGMHRHVLMRLRLLGLLLCLQRLRLQRLRRLVVVLRRGQRLVRLLGGDLCRHDRCQRDVAMRVVTW